MKITPPQTPANGSSGASRSSGTNRQGTTQGSTSGTTSADQAARLTQLESQLAPSDFSSAKVNEISAAITAGNYQVNAGVIADKLLQSTAELARKSS